MSALSLEQLTRQMAAHRADFPILAQMVRPNVPLVYLDNAATTQKPTAVLRAVEDYYTHMNANVHRGVHSFSEKATAAYEAARDAVRDFVGATSAREIIFTRNATEAINLVAYAWGLANLRIGDQILVSEMEHHANIVPWQMVAERAGAHVLPIPITEDGQIDQDAYQTLLGSGRVRMVALAHVSNVLGTINPLADLIRMAHEVGALVTVDGAQSAPHMPIDVRALDADFFALSGHKLCAPTGIGALYGKRALLEAMPPFMGGGSMIDRVTFAKTTYADLPQRFEAGTPNISGAVGLGAAIAYLRGIGLEAIHAHEVALIQHTMAGLADIEGVQMYGPSADQRAGLVSFTLRGVHAHDLSAGLDQAGIAVRAGHHCAMPLHEKFGIAASTRVSFYLYNTLEEADHFVQTVAAVQRFFAR
ncbi:MAG: cysteine desulfurase [Chloroflexi bacterium CFX4]|nr:cysteine desulfurase [Chloroflexi bacterium CFX4]MDL1922786.1 cysteine desulfurase [Chloroflexi bacterium CFX3]